MTELDVSWQIEERCAELILSEEQLREVADRMLTEVNRGLAKETNKEATVKCFPTYVRELPNGTGNEIDAIVCQVVRAE